MKHKTPSPAVLRSCTEAARASAAHAQESANWAGSANQSAIRCQQLTVDMQRAFARVQVSAVLAYIFAIFATFLAAIALIA